jgi:hypothetical protein
LVVLALVAAMLAFSVGSSSGPLLAGPRSAVRQPPNLSGTWTFLESQATKLDGQTVSAHFLIVSGAGFNCGAVCTIAQDARTLRVSRPEEKGRKPRDIALTFASPQKEEGQSAHENPLTATWDGRTLVVTKSIGTVTTRQTIVLQENRLIVTSRMAVGTDSGEIWRQVYVRE